MSVIAFPALAIESIPETCGAYRHAHDVSGQQFLLCYAEPAKVVVSADGETEWGPRGAPVEADEPGCMFFSPRGRA